jgi:tetratricopeptide (TPR) repeat protein
MQAHELQEQIELGKRMVKSKQYKKAEDVLLKVIKKHKLADVYNALGVLYADQGKFNFAETAFTQALKINPTYMEAALNLSVVYNNLGQGKKSKAIYQKLKKYGKSGRGAMDPMLMQKVSNLYAEVGDLYLGVGEYKKASKAFEEAVELCPEFNDIQTKLAISYRDAGQMKKAMKVFTANKRRASKFAPFWLALGTTYYSQGKVKEAKRSWDKAIKLDPKNKMAKAYQKLI